MKNRLINTKYNLVYIVIMILFLYPDNIKGQEIRIEELNISMTLIDLKSKSSEILSNEDAELSTKKIIMKKKDNIQKLLLDNCIYADGESIRILYQLNPGIDFKSINAGEEITFPVIKMKKQFSNIPINNLLIALTLDKRIKQDFLNSTKQLDIAASGIERLSFYPSVSQEMKNNFISRVKSILEKMEVFKVLIRERTRPLNSEMIQQMNDEVDKMKSIIEKAVLQNYILNSKDIDSISLIEKNMTLRMKALNETKGTGNIPSNWPEVCVMVKAIDIKQGKEVENLRVYYVGQGLWNERSKYEKSFNRLTSPSEKFLPEADYFIWLGKPQDSTPLSDRMSLEVRKRVKNEKVELDLVIKLRIPMKASTDSGESFHSL